MCMPVADFENTEPSPEDVVGLSRGPGDPDAHGYPGEPKQEGVEPNGTNEPTAVDDVPF